MQELHRHELLKPDSIPVDDVESVAVLSAPEPELVEQPLLQIAPETLKRKLTVLASDLVRLMPVLKTAEPVLEAAVPDTDLVEPAESGYVFEDSEQIVSFDSLPGAVYPQTLEDLISDTYTTDGHTGEIDPEVVLKDRDMLVDIEEASKLPFETSDEQLDTAFILMNKVFDIDLETFEPEELAEINEILGNLLALIELDIVDLDLDIEALLASETLIEICSVLQEKLGEVFDEKAMRLFIELLVQQYKLLETKPEEMIDIDFLNRMGTWEYRTLEDKPVPSAKLSLREQVDIILRLGGISVLQTVF